MMKRSLDVTCAVLALIVLAPVIALAAVGVRFASPGPVLFRARRAGLGGRPFDMLKLRTMRVGDDAAGSRVTAVNDDRVFPFGRLLRTTKIDELPQLVNIIRGDMSIIGPRPEDPYFVARHYTAEHLETLNIRPGLASPGSLFQDTHGDPLLGRNDTDQVYAERLLPLKLALDLVYVRQASLAYDLRLIGRTISTIAWRCAGRRQFADPPEMAAARAIHVPARASALGSRAGAAATLAIAVLFGACAEAPPQPYPSWFQDTAAVILVGAGDVAMCDRDMDEATAALLDTIPGTIFTTGDNVYPHGAVEDFSRCYEPSWGRHRQRTRPSVGNHEYDTDGASGYFAYFGASAGEPGKGYYSFDLGQWHIIVLNSEINAGDGSPQLEWLRADLAANPRQCVLAYWHRPLFSSGREHGAASNVRAIWDALYAAGADVVLNGHEHLYERFARQDPTGGLDSVSGIRQFTVGTGGASDYAFARRVRNSELRKRGIYGVLALNLRDDAYEWRFVSARKTFADSGSARCHAAPTTVTTSNAP